MVRRLTALTFSLAALLATDSFATKLTVKKLAPLSIGISGYAGAEAARSDAQSLQSYLSQKLGRDVLTRVYPNPSALAAGLAQGEVDLGWMQPFVLIDALSKGAVTPLAKAVRHGLPFYRGVLFTKGKLPVEGLAGLKGLNVAWVNRESSAGYLFPRAAIISAGLKPAELFKSETFKGDHTSVCKAVLDGSVEVGATYADDAKAGKMQVDGCVQALGAEVANQLHIVATSAPIPNDAIAARPGLDPADLERVKKVFLGLKKDHSGQMLLLGTFKADGFDDVGADDFTPVRFAAESGSK